jgi:hypothetical protein
LLQWIYIVYILLPHTDFHILHIPRSEIAYISSTFKFWGNFLLFSTMTLLLYVLTNSVHEFPFQHVFGTLFSYLRITILTVGRWLILLVLLVIPLMITCFEPVHLYLFTICMSSFEKACLFKSFAHF